MLNVQKMLWTWKLVLLVSIALTVCVFADPREVESVEFKGDFGEEYDDRLSRGNDLDQRMEFELEHNIPSGSNLYSKRGKVEFVFSSTSIRPKVSFIDLPLFNANDIKHLETLLKGGKHYTIRARSDPENPESSYVVTSIPMCMLAATRMREDLAFHLSDSGKLVAIEYLTPYNGASNCADYQRRGELKNVKLAASGSVLKAHSGPSPPKQVTQKKKAPKVVKNPVKGEGEDQVPAEENQSFLRKYWYIVLPVVLFSLLGSDPGPQPGPAGAGGAGASGSQASGGGRRR